MIYKMIDAGEFPGGFLAGSARLIRESEVLAWMAAKGRGESPTYERIEPPLMLRKSVPFDPFDDKEFERTLAEVRARMQSNYDQDPNWMPF